MKNKKLHNKNLCKIITNTFIETNELGSTDKERIRNLVTALDDDGEIQYLIACNILYPGTYIKKAENNIRGLRRRVKEAAENAGVEYEISVSTNRKGGNTNRKLWITAGSKLISAAITTIRDNPNYNLEHYLDNLATDIHDKDFNSKKRSFTFFVSYAHDDENQRYNIINEIKNSFKNSDYNIAFLQDKDILIGEKFDEVIKQALDDCDYGLLLISPNFLESDYIKDVEIPALLKRGLLPVGLKKTDFKKLKNVGIEEYQVFTSGDTSKIFYEDTGENLRIHFLELLKLHIEKRIESDEEIKAESLVVKEVYDDKGMIINQGLLSTKEYQKKYHIGLLGERREFKFKSLDPKKTKKIKSRNTVLNEFENWQADLSKPPVFALLGDFGTGKTFTSRILAHKSTERDSKIRKPIFYCDLRWIPKSQETRVPNLEDILLTTLETAEIKDIDVPNIIERFRSGEIIVVFDGLDEKTVYMTDAEAQQFFNELMTIMPKKTEDREKCRLVFTCRTHYFKTFVEQNNFFSGQQRGDLGEGNFTGMEILMLNPEQIEEYLEKRFPTDELKRIRINHILKTNDDIADLAKRPYLLSLICDVLPDIREDEKMNLASIYNLFVELWYKRDDTKHQLLTRHKEILINDLATDMWKAGQRSFSINKLDKWFDEWYLRNRDLHHFYSDKIKDNADFLSDDIRTASFLVRFRESDFRFAHSSLQEFFVARQMISSLKEDNKIAWNELKPNKEIMEFFYALWEIDEERTLLNNSILKWLDVYDREINPLLFRIWLDLSLPNNNKINLEDTELSDIIIKNLTRKDMSFINLQNATLENSHLKNIDLSNAGLNGFKIYNSTIDNIILDGTEASIKIFESGYNRKLQVDGKDILKEQFKKKKIKEIISKANISLGHSSTVHSVAFSPDGKKIVSGSDDNTIKIWEIGTGYCLNTLKGHSFEVNSVAFSPDGKKIVSGSWDNTIKIWDAGNGKCLNTLTGHNYVVNSVTFSPDGKKIVSGARDNTIKIWDISKGYCLNTLKGHSSTVHSVAFSPDGKKIVSGAGDNTIKIWDICKDYSLNTLKGHTSGVYSVTFSPDGKKIVSGAGDNIIKIWDADNGRCLDTLKGDSSMVCSVTFSPDGKKIVSGSGDNTIKIWDTSSGKCLNTLKGHRSRVYSVAFSPDGKKIVSGAGNNTIKIWNTRSGKCLNTLKGRISKVCSVAVSPDGKKIVSGSDDNIIKIWDTSSGKFLNSLKGHISGVYSVTFSPDGKKIVSGSWDNTIKIWDTSSGKFLSSLKGHSSEINSVAVSPDGKKILSGARNNTINIWDSSIGYFLNTLKGHISEVNSVAFSPDGKKIVSGSWDSTIKIWDTHSGRCLNTLKGDSHTVNSVAFSPDGKKIVSGSDDNTIKIWDSSTGKYLNSLKGHISEVNSVAFSPDGKKIVSGSDDNTIKIWDTDNGRCSNTLNEHSSGVNSVAFTPDGKKIVSGSDDNTIKIWDTDNGRCLRNILIIDNESYLLINPKDGEIEFATGNAWQNLFGEAITEDGEKIYFNPEFLETIAGLD